MGEIDAAIYSVVNELIDSCIMDDILHLHRAIKLGYSHLILADSEDVDGGESDSATLHSSSRPDPVNRSSACCRCVKCHCKVAATRYASHLSNCMGLGRNSSRRANKRIAEQQRFEDSDDVDDARYLDHSPMSSSGHKHDYPSLSNYPKNQSSGFPSRASKNNNVKISGLSTKSSNGRNANNSLPAEPVFEKTDSFDSISFSCDDDESNSSEATRRSGVSRIRRHQKLHV
ncbi:SAGA-associated factor 11 -like protein [Echinococcus granulosus]|uniref:SAGA-associated factor 11 n=1 Tax=Echinococcus granulosus TaxID=6210 RepID=A0A068WDH0_ECHGR|nr:SAGA-associated factor 11 -like protein [Echinococcus granulosus]CDS18142.1 ataxin 7 protein 3 [Echinococcus granulosus]